MSARSEYGFELEREHKRERRGVPNTIKASAKVNCILESVEVMQRPRIATAMDRGGL
jgi:hypothetical protein